MALTKSQINILPCNVPVINWKGLWGLTMADVKIFESLRSIDEGGVSVETTSPVVVE